MLSTRERAFLACQRVAHLATADARAVPHVVPVCFAVAQDSVYITIDEKPKSATRRLKRLRNISQNRSVAVITDRYDEDWTRLGWVLLQGRADILDQGDEHDAAQRLLCERYPQLQSMRIAQLPVIAVRIQRVTSWGNLMWPVTCESS